MSEQLDELIRQAQCNCIKDITEIDEICKKVLSIRLKELVPSVIEGTIFNYIMQQMCNGFELNFDSCLNEMMLDEFMYLLMAAKDFEYFEDGEVPPRPEIERNLFPLYLSGRFTEVVLDAKTNNSAIRRWLSIDFETYLNYLSSHSKSTELDLQVVRCRKHLYDTLKYVRKENDTIADVLAFLRNERRRPWNPGLESFNYYRAKMVVINVLANFIFVDVLDYLYDYTLSLDISLIEKYEKKKEDIRDDE